MKKFAWPLTALIVVAIGCSSAEKPAAPATTTTEPAATTPTEPAAMAVAFADVDAIMKEKCVTCHGEKPKEDLDLRTFDSLMKGGEHGPVVVAGDPENSILIQALRGTGGKKRMPMMADPLSEDEIKKFEEWIKAGAKA